MTRWLRYARAPALLLAAAAAIGFALRAVGFDPRGSEAPSVPAYLVLGTLACAAGVPRQVAAFAAGYWYGVWPGCALALAAETAACAIDFWWARLLGRNAAARFLRRREGGRLDRLDRFLRARAFTATLTLRLLPVGSNIVLNLLAGVSGVAAAPFLLASLLGYVPQTVVFALAGAGTGVSDGLKLALAGVLLAASVGLGVVLLRRPGVGT